MWRISDLPDGHQLARRSSLGGGEAPGGRVLDVTVIVGLSIEQSVYG